MADPKYTLLPQHDNRDHDGEHPQTIARDVKNRPLYRKNKLFAFSLISLTGFLLFFAGSSMLNLASLQSIFPGKHHDGKYTPTKEKPDFKGLPEHYTLPSGDKIPSVALGVAGAGKDQVGRAVKAALRSGYRHIDGAWVYGNEIEVGQALKESGVPREEVWITSKLWNLYHAPEDVERALDYSLRRLDTHYLDLYLIHWPVATNKDGTYYDKNLTENPYPTWKKLEEMVDKGKVRNIGVSNFNERRLKNLTANPLKYQPAVNQVELNYFLPQPELLKWSKRNGILLEAYSPLGSSKRVKESLKVPEVKEIAAQTGLTPAQVIISWHVQRGTVVLPKSATPSRVKENFQVAKLPHKAFKKLEKAAASHPPSRGSNPRRLLHHQKYHVPYEKMEWMTIFLIRFVFPVLKPLNLPHQTNVFTPFAPVTQIPFFPAEFPAGFYCPYPSAHSPILLTKIWPIFSLALHIRFESRQCLKYTLVTHGPYGVVRHPAYAGSWLVVLGIVGFQSFARISDLRP
ncbi:hypothetical protein L218DRAFT_997679 [Marasmius fiardii PR-910]|nr:hypothetical protein L218DRAFT_997679 [Marasmius fiardii PR-910]